MKEFDSIKITDHDEMEYLYQRTAKFISSTGTKTVIIKLIKDNFVYFVDNGFVLYKSELINDEYFIHENARFLKKNFIKCRGD